MLLLRLIAVFLIFYVLANVLRTLIGRRLGGPSSRLNSKPDGEEMVLDPQCHSYVPKSAAVLQSGRFFCSQECALLYLSGR
jgi:hypothetical protein